MTQTMEIWLEIVKPRSKFSIRLPGAEERYKRTRGICMVTAFSLSVPLREAWCVPGSTSKQISTLHGDAGLSLKTRKYLEVGLPWYTAMND